MAVFRGGRWIEPLCRNLAVAKVIVLAVFVLVTLSHCYSYCSSPGANQKVLNSPESQTELDGILRATRECGINSLYMFLHLSDNPVDFQLVKSSNRIGPLGSSMSDLCEAARRFGTRLSIRQVTRNDLVDLQRPVIAYLKPSVSFGSPTEPRSGHYVVVIAAHKNGLRVIDGSFGNEFSVSWEAFERRWQGHILLETESWEWWWVVLCAIGIIGFTCVVLTLFSLVSRFKVCASVIN